MNRRAFLEISARAAAAATLVPFASAAPKRSLRKAIMYSTIGVKGSVLEKFQAMKAAGFEGVEPMGAMNRDEVIAAAGPGAHEKAAPSMPAFGTGGHQKRLRAPSCCPGFHPPPARPGATC